MSGGKRPIKFFAATKSIWLALVITVIIHLLGGIFSFPFASWLKLQEQDSLNALLAEVIDTELEDTQAHAQAIAALPEIITGIEQGQNANLLGYSLHEAEARGLTSVVIIDKDGVVLSRSATPSKRGDYVFQISDYGAALADGQPLTTFSPGNLSPLVLISGQFINTGTENIGIALAVTRLEDPYARELRDEYFPAGSEVVFISNVRGLSGSSFADQDIRNQLSAALDVPALPTQTTPSSLQDGDSVRLGNKTYTVTTVPLQGLSSDIGSVLLFTPSSQVARATLLAASGAIIFFILETLWHRKLYRRHPGHRHTQVFGLVILTIFLADLLIALLTFQRHTLQFSSATQTIYNSTMSLQPESSVVSAAYDQRVSIIVHNGGEAINGVEAVLEYDPTAIEILEINTDTSLCSPDFIIEKTISPETGTVTVVCLTFQEELPSPAVLAELLIKPLRTGTYTLNFHDSTRVLAKDGLGTDVLRATTDGSYTVVMPGEPAGIFSLSHRNSARWYPSATASLRWPLSGETSFLYSLTREPGHNLNGLEQLTHTDRVNLQVPGDGEYYFHLYNAQGEPIPHFEPFHFKVDTQPPEAPVIRASDLTPRVGEVVRMSFESSDAMSGLQSSYFVKIDGGILLPIGQELFIPFSTVGSHEILVRAYDNANNYSESTVYLDVKP
jgi:hypothetical protein